jgi:hypothetical protein
MAEAGQAPHNTTYSFRDLLELLDDRLDLVGMADEHAALARLASLPSFFQIAMRDRGRACCNQSLIRGTHLHSSHSRRIGVFPVDAAVAVQACRASRVVHK